MPAAYSRDLRQRVLEAYKAKGSLQRQLAKRFKVSLSFVQRIIKRQKQTRQVTPKAHGGGAKALLGQKELEKVQQLVSAQPDALLSELCERLASQTGTVVSVTTMHRAVKRLQLTTKKNSLCKCSRKPKSGKVTI